jgi:DNA polymerase III delta subunit
MIYFLHGENKDRARQKAGELREALLRKKPDALSFTINSENWSEALLDEKIESQGLFENKYIVFIDSVFEDKEAKSAVLDRLTEISTSENVFIFLEGKIDKATLGRIEKKAEKVQVFNQSAVGKSVEGASGASGDFNIFSLTDALGRRDKKQLWILYTQAQSAEVAPEEIHGVLWWQVKSMIVASEARSAESADMKQFVFQKAKIYARNYSKTELDKLANDLVVLYHQSHRGQSEMSSALEQLVLSV